MQAASDRVIIILYQARMRQDEEDFHVPSDQELERLMRKANQKASKESSFKKTTKQQYISQVSELIKEIYKEEEENPHLILKCLALQCLKDISDLHCETAYEKMNKDQYECAANWMSDQGKIAAAYQLLQSVRIGEDDWMV